MYTVCTHPCRVPRLFALADPFGVPSAAAPTASAVKELRGKTGAGMMDCKKALTATGSNVEEAMEVLH